jgi:hypothetical protein
MKRRLNLNFHRCSAAILLCGSLVVPIAALADVPVSLTTKLIKSAAKGVEDANGWAFDLHDALAQNGFEQSRENVCAAIAVIAQESTFQADPPVAGLGAISEKAIREKFGRIPVAGNVALRWLENNPSSQTSFMARIRNAKTERDLDLAYRALVEHAGKASSMDAILKLGLLNTLIEDKNEIDTAGSMQVSVKFAIDETKKDRWLPMTLNDVYAVRDRLYTRQGGMYFGIKQLLGYDTGYGQKVFRFADFNAGRYASRNAAFQQAVSVLSGDILTFDGDLLIYNKDGKALGSLSATEKALRLANEKRKLGLDNASIRKDLLKEKDVGFTSTRTFTVVRDRFAQLKGKPAAFAAFPQIVLGGPKISRGFTTQRFAERVNSRYQACMQVK